MQVGFGSASEAAYPTPFGDLNRYDPAMVKYLITNLIQQKAKERQQADLEASLQGIDPQIAAIARMAEKSPEAARLMAGDRAAAQAKGEAEQQRIQQQQDEEAGLRKRLAITKEFQDKAKLEATEEARTKFEMLMKALRPGGQGPGGAPMPGAAVPGAGGAAPVPGAAPPAPGVPAGPEPIPDDMYEELRDTMSRIPGIDMSALTGFIPQSQHDKEQQQAWSNRVKEQQIAKEQAEEQAATQEIEALGPEAVRRARIYGPKETLKYFDDRREKEREREIKREDEGRQAAQKSVEVAGAARAKQAEVAALEKQLDALMGMTPTPENEGRLHQQRGNLMAKIAKLKAEAEGLIAEGRGLRQQAIDAGAAPEGTPGAAQPDQQGEQDNQDLTDLRRAQQTLAYMKQQGDADPASMQALEEQIQRVKARNPRLGMIGEQPGDADMGAVMNGRLPVSREGKIRLYKAIFAKRQEAERNGMQVPPEVFEMERELAGQIQAGR